MVKLAPQPIFQKVTKLESLLLTESGNSLFLLDVQDVTVLLLPLPVVKKLLMLKLIPILLMVSSGFKTILPLTQKLFLFPNSQRPLMLFLKLKKFPYPSIPMKTPMLRLKTVPMTLLTKLTKLCSQLSKVEKKTIKKNVKPPQRLLMV